MRGDSPADTEEQLAAEPQHVQRYPGWPPPQDGVQLQGGQQDGQQVRYQRGGQQWRGERTGEQSLRSTGRYFVLAATEWKFNKPLNQSFNFFKHFQILGCFSEPSNAPY